MDPSKIKNLLAPRISLLSFTPSALDNRTCHKEVDEIILNAATQLTALFAQNTHDTGQCIATIDSLSITQLMAHKALVLPIAAANLSN